MALLEIIGIGVGAFVATNIDDLFILIVFFAKRNFPTWQIILGQYVGMASLLGVSLFASLISILIPQNLIGLYGLLPIAIGIKELIEVRNAASDRFIKIHPSLQQLIVSLRTAVVMDDWKLDNQQTSHPDTLDSLRLALCNYELPQNNP